MSIAVLDIDGTLVDTNYHHTIAWYRAFGKHGIVLPIWRIHRHIGMGGDQLVTASPTRTPSASRATRSARRRGRSIASWWAKWSPRPERAT